MLDLKKLLTKIIKNTPQVRHRFTSLGAVPANSYKDFTVTFSSAMKGEPSVVCSMYSTSTSPTMGGLTVSAINPSSTGFTCRVFNNTSSQRTPAIEYIAIYGGVLHNLFTVNPCKGVAVC